MQKELKVITIISSLIVSANIYASTLVESSACYMPPLSMKHDKNAKYDFFSDHSVSIKNTTGKTQKYHVLYNHNLPNIMGSSPFEFDVTLENGKSYADSRRYNTSITLGISGVYGSQAITRISNNGKIISSCVSNNKINVF